MSGYKWINYKKLYPNADKEVITYLVKTDRKIKYRDLERKKEMIMIDQENEKVTVIPSKEDSFERLTENNYEFGSEDNVEDEAIKNVMCEKLHICISMLKPKEQEIIHALFFDSMSERQLSSKIGIPRMTICDRKKKILKKLKNFWKMQNKSAQSALPTAI